MMTGQMIQTVRVCIYKTMALNSIHHPPNFNAIKVEGRSRKIKYNYASITAEMPLEKRFCKYGVEFKKNVKFSAYARVWILAQFISGTGWTETSLSYSQG